MIDDYIKHLLSLINRERDYEREIRDLTADERERKGRTVNNLSAKPIKNQLNKNIVKFSRLKNIKTEINVGNQVKISKGNPLRSDLIGTVTEKRPNSISVAFDRKLSEELFNSKIRMDLIVNDVTFTRMENNLKNLNERGEYVIKLISQNIRYGYSKKDVDLNYRDFRLNDSQKEAIIQSLYTKDFFLIHGPFGTGKTDTLVELIYQEVKNDNKVLATAESNIAVDNIVERLTNVNGLDITRLGNPQNVSKDIKSQTIICKLEKHDLYSKIERFNKEVERLSMELDDSKSKPKSNSRKNFLRKEIGKYNGYIRKTEKIIVEDII